ncbi:MAG TPA: thioredoxin family protein, partial [Terracidiphilus sp.]|nr:thioredoxin family protein [Terracidiphilus sp.]
MRFLRLTICLLVLLWAGVPALAASDAADTPHVHVQLVVPARELGYGSPVEAGLYFKLEPGWHIYWKNAGDAGEPPKVQWTLPAGISATQLEFPAPKRLPLGPLMDFGYEHEVLFPFSFQVDHSAKTGAAVLHAKANWLVCRATCIPGKAELEVTRKVAAGAAQMAPSSSDADLIARFRAQVPKPMPAGWQATFASATGGFELRVATGKTEKQAVFFPADEGVLDNAAPQKLTPAARGFALDLKKDEGLKTAPPALNGVIEFGDGQAVDVSARPGSAAVGRLLPAQAALMGVVKTAPEDRGESAGTGGGAHASTSPLRAFWPMLRVAGLAFLGGLLLNLMPCVFPVLFLKGLALVRSGSEEKRTLRAHGFVYASGILVSFWVLVAMLLALRSAGAVLGWGFQFQSPVFLSLMAGLLFFLGLSLAGQFELGLTMTSAGGGLAAKQGYTGSFFTGVLAVVVATPCTAPFMGAAIGYALAQSAAVTFAVFTALALGLAAPYVALTLHPAWTRWLPRPGAWMEVLKQAVSVPIFATVIWLLWVLAQAYGAGVLAAVLAGFLLLAVAGWFLGRWPAKRWAAVAAGLMVAAVAVMNVVAPGRLAVAEQSATGTQAGASLAWEPWSAESVSRYQAQGRVVFVDFTAKWCLSCQVNERVALERPEVQQAFAARNVALLRADWTRHDEAITQALASLGRDGVPTYLLYVPGES